METTINGKPKTPDLASTLLRLVADDVVTVAELCDVSGRSDSAISRYQGDEAYPSWPTVEAWARSPKLPLSVTLSLARVLVGGRPVMILATEGSKNLDFDGDGKVTSTDALQAMHAAARTLAEETIALTSAMQDGRITAEEFAAIDKLGQDVIDSVHGSLQVLRRVAETKQPNLKIGG